MEIKNLSEHAEQIKQALINDDSISPEIKQGLIKFIDVALSKLTIQGLLVEMKQDNVSMIQKNYCRHCIHWDNQKIWNTGQCSSPDIRKGIRTKATVIKTYEYFSCRYYESKFKV